MEIGQLLFFIMFRPVENIVFLCGWEIISYGDAS